MRAASPQHKRDFREPADLPGYGSFDDQFIFLFHFLEALALSVGPTGYT